MGTSILSNLNQGSQEWLNWKIGKIGGSYAPVIMGVSKWKTPYELWQEMLGLKDKEAANFAQKRGLELEETARKKFEEATGYRVFPQVITHPDYDWLIASLDGMSIDGKVIVEIKCPGREDHETALAGVIPKHYYPQLQHILMIENTNTFYFSYYPNQEGIPEVAIVEVERNDDYIKELFEAEKSFYENYYLQLTPPPLNHLDYHPYEDQRLIETVEEYLNVQDQIEKLTQIEKNLKSKIINIAGERNIKGAGITVSKVERRGNINYSEIPELKNVDLEKYRSKSSCYWTIRKA